MTVEVRDQYYNMREKVEPVMHIIDIAEKAIEAPRGMSGEGDSWGNRRGAAFIQRIAVP